MKKCEQTLYIYHCKNRLAVLTTLIAWLTSVLETNCIRQPVSLLFRPPSGIRKRGGTDKKLLWLFLQLASDSKISDVG